LEFRAWNDRAWSEAADCGVDISKTSCRVELLDTFDGAKSYCAKYCSKNVAVGVATGRIWGCHSRKLLPITLKVEVLDPDVAKLVTRALVRHRQATDRKPQVLLEGKWVPIRLRVKIPQHPKSGRRRKYRRLDAEEEMLRLRLGGLRTRWKKARVLWTSKVYVWSEVIDDYGCARMVRDEWPGHRITQAPRTSFLATAEVDRIVQWAKLEAARRREALVDLPF
jgi:hypothetical protein